jgi:PHD/YefM family antitoxin component YafN of YafNO toxin-antitoxin module
MYDDSDDYPLNNPVQHSILQRRIKEIEQGIELIPLRNNNVSHQNNEMDETEYLLSDPERRNHLLHAVSDVENGQNIVMPKQEQF